MHIPPTRLHQTSSGQGFSPAPLSPPPHPLGRHVPVHRELRKAWNGTKLLLLGGVATLLCGSGITARGAGLANPNSNANTKAVYNYISGLTGGTSKRVLSGQNVLWFEPSSNGDTYVNDLIWNLENQTGKFPAIVGADLNDTNTNACI